MSELRAVATIMALPESHDHVRDVLTALVVATREEEGCLSYDLFESASAPNTFVTIETWRTSADLEAHLATPHVAAAFEAAAGHLVTAPGVHPLNPVA